MTRATCHFSYIFSYDTVLCPRVLGTVQWKEREASIKSGTQLNSAERYTLPDFTAVRLLCAEQGCTTCCSLAAGLRENGERMHIVGLTRICRFSPRIQQFSSRFRRELLNSPLEICNSRRDENCFSPLTTRIAQFSVTLERMRELLFSGEQRRQ